MRTAAVLTAAGSGSRLGHHLPKALVPLDGTPLVTHAARRLVASGGVDLLVVTVPDGHDDAVRAALGAVVQRAAPGTAAPDVPVLLVPGGPSRQASVAAALAVLPADVDVVLVHDAARALVPPALVARVVAAVRSGHRAVIPALAVTDTVVEVGVAVLTRAGGRAGGAGGTSGVPDSGSVAGADGDAHVVPVAGTLDRASLRAVQTPQGFDRAVLDRAHAAAADRAHDERVAATDDSSLVALLGEPVVAVPGDERALKITTRRDLALAGLLLAEPDRSAS